MEKFFILLFVAIVSSCSTGTVEEATVEPAVADTIIVSMDSTEVSEVVADSTLVK